MNKPLTLKKILIKTKKQVFSEIIGNNTSQLKGEGYDFLELKEYEYGEDVKNIDWIISAKMHKPYVKVFHAQKELNINIIAFLSGSVHFGTCKLKQELITEICSMLAFSSLKQGDPFSSYIANESLQLNTKKSKKIHTVQSMNKNNYEYNVLGKRMRYTTIVDELFKTIKKRSILFLIGDFFDAEDLDLKLLCQKHELYVIIVRDIFEEEPQALGKVNFIDPGDYFNYQGNMDQASIKNYTARCKKKDHELYLHLQKCGAKMTKIYTHEEPLSKIIGLLKR